MNKKKLLNTSYYFHFLLIFSCFIIACKDDSKGKLNEENIEKGKQLFSSVGCITCHSLSNKKLYGPSLDSILGTTIKVLRKDIEHIVLIDRNYLKKSISNPDFEKPLEYKNTKMPTPNLTNIDINCIVDYLISINKAK